MMIGIIVFVLIIYFFSACSKEVLSDVDKQKVLLSGTGGTMSTERVWKLDSVLLNNTPLKLSAIQKKYKKTFAYNGDYSDSDLNTGKWSINQINNLIQVNTLPKKNDTTKYDILSIDQYKLILKNTIGSESIIYFFIISN